MLDNISEKNFSELIRENNLEEIKFLVESCDLALDDEQYYEGELTYIAASRGYLDILKYLIKSGCCINFDESEEVEAAAENGHIHILKYLTNEIGYEINVKDGYIFQLACANGHLKMVRYLVEETSLNLDLITSSSFKEAVKNGHLDVAEYLISKNSNYDYKNDIDEILERVIYSDNNTIETLKYLEKLGYSYKNKKALLENTLYVEKFSVIEFIISRYNDGEKLTKDQKNEIFELLSNDNSSQEHLAKFKKLLLATNNQKYNNDCALSL